MKRLSGGHRNDVFKTNGQVKIVWKNGLKRREKIRKGVLLEDFVAAHTDIRARLLVDKSKPIQQEGGKLVTYFHYAAGEIRYPWNLAEIASAAKLLGKLHGYLKARPALGGPGLIKQLHLDFARGNILFQSATSTAVGAIDFETTAIGPVEQEFGRTLSFLLVDTPANYDRDDPSRSILQGSSLFNRWNTFLTNYSLPYRKDRVSEWTRKYLETEDYGDLNHMRDKAINWLAKLKL